ncbi:MAG: phenylalanine--tRNA ligase subunit alpha [candidate division Zixibacteria bacterium]|nr:phenylalanine--tRNA ligase subunit alpha [candidate division Zixibacteria bacterium]
MSNPANIDRILSDGVAELEKADDAEKIGEVKIHYLGRKGLLSAALKGLKDLSIDERKAFGAAANNAKSELAAKIEGMLSALKPSTKADLDYTLPGQTNRLGRLHPLTRGIKEITEIFRRMGFAVATGPEIETDYYNFGALNFPEDHPARDMQDTFYLSETNGLPPGLLLRTHTSNVQIREFERRKPPLKIIAPGKVYRHEAVSSRAYCVFHQVEGFQVGENISMADMKGALVGFCHEYFSPEIELRFRPSFFPFTEPSAEVDVSCIICDGKGCSVCKYDGWLEILGCGMIDPNVMTAVGYDPEKYTGYAFGMGVERIVMLKRRITDIRLFYENDIRFTRKY